MQPENGPKSPEETAAAAPPVSFDAPATRRISGMGAPGRPAGQPYDGPLTHRCADRCGRLPAAPGAPPGTGSAARRPARPPGGDGRPKARSELSGEFG
ncbi:hypothetical protein ACFV3B_20100, partial [Streptomyces sp. NPDC059710]